MTRTPLWWVPPDTCPPTADTVEFVAIKLYERQVADSLFVGIPWQELNEDEREDVRSQVRSVFDIVEILVPGLLGYVEPLVSAPAPHDACEPVVVELRAIPQFDTTGPEIVVSA